MHHSHLWAHNDPCNGWERKWEKDDVNLCGTLTWTWGCKEWNAVSCPVVTWALRHHGSSLGHWWVFRNCKLTTHFFSTHVPLLWQSMTRDTIEYKTYIGNTCIMIEIFDWTLLNKNISIPSCFMSVLCFPCAQLEGWDSFMAALTLPSSP